MENYRSFKPVRAFGRKPGLIINVSTAYDAAVFLLQEWPDESGPKHLMAREIMLTCLEGGCSPVVARVEAAREAGLYVEQDMERPPSTGRLGPKWGKPKAARRA